MMRKLMTAMGMLVVVGTALADPLPMYHIGNPCLIRGEAGHEEVAKDKIIDAEPGDPVYDLTSKYGSKTVWFKWSAMKTGRLELDTKGSIRTNSAITQTPPPLDTFLCVCLKGENDPPQTSDILNYDADTSDDGLTSSITVYVEAGNVYYLGVGVNGIEDGGKVCLNYKFSELKARIRFDARGGSVTATASSVYDDSATLGAEKPFPSTVRAGYDFLGWFTEPVGGVQIKDSDTIDAVKDLFVDEDGVPYLYLYAQWRLSGTSTTTPLLDNHFDKKQIVTGALLTNFGGLVGAIQLTVSKKNKKGIATVKIIITRYDVAKRIGAKCNLTFADDGSATSDAIKIAFKDSMWKDDTMCMNVKPDGSFTLAGNEYRMYAAAVGGALAVNELKFNLSGIMDDLPKAPSGFRTIDSALPTNYAFSVISSGRKFSFEKGAALKYVKVKLTGRQRPVYVLWNNDSSNKNRSQLKLSYNYNKGIFKGSFKVYATNGDAMSNTKPKLKSTSVTVYGLVIGGYGWVANGWGSATMKSTNQRWLLTLNP